jgi:Cof subfamily protein (haloacid dehalogenase superfamily)
MHFEKADIENRLVIEPDTIKKFVFDLDGTIIYDGKPLTPEFEKILLEIKAAGHEVIFATGRSWRDFVPVIPSWCAKEPSVVFGGGLVIKDQEIRRQHFLSEFDLADIVEFLENNHVPYLVDGRSEYYHPHNEHWLYQDIIELTGQKKSGTIDNIISDGAYKVLVLDEKLLDYFHEFIKRRNLVIKYHFYDKCFDVMPAQVNKYLGFCDLGEYDSNNVFVFGNDHNDLELMQELPNSIMLGHHQELQKYAKIRIDYDDDLLNNLTTVVSTILCK